MQKFKLAILLIGLLISLLVTPSFAETNQAVAEAKKAFTDPNTVIVTHPKEDEIILKLKSNPTTGYAWFLIKYNQSLLAPLSRTYHRPTKQLAGASGYEIWAFKVKKSAFIVPQLTSITLQYARPWVKSDTARKLTYTVVIHPSADLQLKKQTDKK